MKDAIGLDLKIGDVVRYFTENGENSFWSLGKVDYFGEGMIVVENYNDNFTYTRYHPREPKFVFKATSEILMLHKLESK